MSEAVSTQGVYIATSDSTGSPETWSELAEVVSIGGPNETSEELDVTHLRSPGTREFIQSYKDGGELPLEMNFVSGSSSQRALLADYEANPSPVKRRRIFYPDGSTDTFNCFVKSRSKTMGVGAVLRLSCTLRITGPVVEDLATVSPALP